LRPVAGLECFGHNFENLVGLTRFLIFLFYGILKMNFHYKCLLFAPAILVLSAASNAQYTATILTPSWSSNSVSYGAAGTNQIGFATENSNDRALLWNGSSSNYINLNPTGFSDSYGKGVSSSDQVGYGLLTNVNYHALQWFGSAASVIDLHPSGHAFSQAFATSGAHQVGNADFHAALWTGTAGSFVDLNPTGFRESEAWGVDGSQQVGFGVGASTGELSHAILWNSSSTSYVDLNPAGMTSSQAFGIAGGQQVGTASNNSSTPHAMLWTGTAASAIDLNPVGFTSSYLNATNGFNQVGYGFGSTGEHALVWSGTAASAIDLHGVLPTWILASYATGISSNGDIVGYGFDSNRKTTALLWSPVPEPSSIAVLGLGALALLRRLRRK
jgi:hypothetical protein